MITLFTILGYNFGLLELSATLISLFSIYLLTKVNPLGWPVSLVSQTLFAILFFQMSLWANFALQFYFCWVSVLGWLSWNKPNDKIKLLTNKQRIFIVLGVITSIASISFFNEWKDTSIMVLSIVASYLMSKKFLDSWFFWIICDFFCIYLYWITGIKLVSIEYVILLINALFGVTFWIKTYKKENE